MKARRTPPNRGSGSNVSVKKVGWLMKDTAERAEPELEKTKLRSKFAVLGKTMLQTLNNQVVPPTHMAQLSGQTNFNSIEN